MHRSPSYRERRCRCILGAIGQTVVIESISSGLVVVVGSWSGLKRKEGRVGAGERRGWVVARHDDDAASTWHVNPSSVPSWIPSASVSGLNGSVATPPL